MVHQGRPEQKINANALRFSEVSNEALDRSLLPFLVNRSAMKSFVAWLLVFAFKVPTLACTMSFAPVAPQTDASRIAAIELTMKHGAVASLYTVPVGWQIRIYNDPSWNTKVAGHAVVGAAFLQYRQLSEAISIRPEPGYSCSDLEKFGFIALKLKIYQNDRLSNVIVSHQSLHIAD